MNGDAQDDDHEEGIQEGMNPQAGGGFLGVLVVSFVVSRLYFHIHTRRFKPYTTESVTNEMASSTSAVALAPA